MACFGLGLFAAEITFEARANLPVLPPEATAAMAPPSFCWSWSCLTMPDANCDGGVVWEEEIVRLDFHRLRCKFKQMVELIRSLQVCLLTRKPSDAAFAAMCVPSFSPASLLGFFPVFGFVSRHSGSCLSILLWVMRLRWNYDGRSSDHQPLLQASRARFLKHGRRHLPPVLPPLRMILRAIFECTSRSW